MTHLTWAAAARFYGDLDDLLLCFTSEIFAADIFLRKQVRSEGAKRQQRLLGRSVCLGRADGDGSCRKAGGVMAEKGPQALGSRGPCACTPTCLLAWDSHLTLPLFHSGTHMHGHSDSELCLFTAVTVIHPLKNPDIKHLGMDD